MKTYKRKETFSVTFNTVEPCYFNLSGETKIVGENSQSSKRLQSKSGQGKWFLYQNNWELKKEKQFELAGSKCSSEDATVRPHLKMDTSHRQKPPTHRHVPTLHQAHTCTLKRTLSGPEGIYSQEVQLL